jgi:hypothetical protein
LLFTVLTGGLGALLFWGVPEELQRAEPVLVTACLLSFLSALIIISLDLLGRSAQNLVLTGFLFGAFLLTLSFGFELVEESYSARHLSLLVKEVAGPATVVAEYKDHLHGLPFYLQRRIVQVSHPRETQFEEPGACDSYLYDSLEQFEQDLKPDQHALLVVRDSDILELKNRGWAVIYSGSWYILERRTLNAEL